MSESATQANEETQAAHEDATIPKQTDGEVPATSIGDEFATLTRTNSSNKYDYSTDPHGVTREDVRSIDPYLDALIYAVLGDPDYGDGSFGITVMCSGSLVTGTAISRSMWEQEWLQAIGDVSPDISEVLDAAFAKQAARIRSVQRERAVDERPPAALRYLNLRDVSVDSPQGSFETPLWRCRLTQIDGWTNVQRVESHDEQPNNN